MGSLTEERSDQGCWQGRRWREMFTAVCPGGQWQEKRSGTRGQERGHGRSR